MCGIAGILRWNADVSGADPDQDLHTVRRMIRVSAHRGPDAEGFLSKQPITLGHARLAVVDIQGGVQPMRSMSGDCVIIYNGEIYGTQHLRQNMIEAGYTFTTNSDTEVLLRSYERWGTGCFKKIQGMFSCAIVDFKRRELVLARDPFGIKPLVYSCFQGSFAFSSEINSLKELPVPRVASLDALDACLRWQYIPDPMTAYKGIHKLPPGSVLRVGFDGKAHQIERFSFPEIGPPEQGCPIVSVESALKESVRNQLIADVPVGVFCSGGIDSALICAAARDVGADVEAFGLGSDLDELDETQWAKHVAKQLGIKFHTKSINENDLGIIETLAPQFGEPFADSSAVAAWHVSQLAKEHVTVCLSGDGADELFGGYDSYARLLRRASLRSAFEVFPHAKGLALRTLMRFLRVKNSSPFKTWLECVEFSRGPLRHSLWIPELKPEDTSSNAHRLAWDQSTTDYLSAAQQCDQQTYLCGDILTKVDIASMAHSLEVRVPFLDPQVSNIARSLRFQDRHDTTKSSTMAGKPLLRQIVAQRFGSEIARRPKQGFAVPVAQWFLKGHGGEQLLRSCALSSGCRVLSLFCGQQIESLLNAHDAGQNRSNELWAVLCIALWIESDSQVCIS